MVETATYIKKTGNEITVTAMFGLCKSLLKV